MIILRDEITIAVPPERIFAWLNHLPENYREWHPDHVAYRYLTDGGLREGAVIYCEEYLHGDLHKFKMRATQVIPNARLDYRIAPGMRGSFGIEARNGNSLFIAELFFGVGFPVLGWVLDQLLRLLFARQIKLFRQHIAEEGQNLRRIMETGEGVV